jgi:hypothetical protein
MTASPRVVLRGGARTEVLPDAAVAPPVPAPDEEVSGR